MEKLVSNWFNLRPVPEDYIFPPETRPGNLHVPIGKGIPVIDLSEAEEGDRTIIIEKILKAAQEHGFFQVINHGVSENLMNETMRVLKEFFQMPCKSKQKFYSDDVSKNCVLSTSINYATEKVHLWRDFLKHPCYPLEKWQHIWPESPDKYREYVGACSVEVKKLASRILRLVSEGFGLNSEYFEDGLSGHIVLSANLYPPCPEPSLTLGTPKHRDADLITILLQDEISGLQVLKDNAWIGVEPIPHAFVVNIGCFLQVISNNKLRSVEHRVVTNSKNTRMTATFFVTALEGSTIEPEKALTDELHPPFYKPFMPKEFVSQLLARNINSEATLNYFKA